MLTGNTVSRLLLSSLEETPKLTSAETAPFCSAVTAEAAFNTAEAAVTPCAAAPPSPSVRAWGRLATTKFRGHLT
ncbi:hypothetical protein DFP90_1413 [Aestuariispira insulae]|uniref:Uncharacterized protein n=1 Tax=Aestuariispira insulae TaxID=1461337 RepID=A0A3D9H0N9_9PROT|nr:hypothetical protein DFP90_1413 [Aestuariispira insulae]